MHKIIFTLLLLPFTLLGKGKDDGHQHSGTGGYIENKGQWDKQILFKTKFQGGNLWIQQHKFLFHLTDYSDFQKAHANLGAKGNIFGYKQDIVHLNFLNSNEVSNITKEKKSSNYYNYFIGKDETKWASSVFSYQSCTLPNLYNGIDLKLLEEHGQLKYEFHVKPTVSPSLIQLNYAGQKGIYINKLGHLIIETKNGLIQENKPYCYQLIDGKEIEIKCDFELNKENVTFKLGKYNEKYELIIDPILIFATYCGSVTDNFGMTATYGHDGAAYSAGTVYGNAYPTPDNLAFNISSNFTVANISGNVTTDAFISKYTADGTQMLWTTFLGGGDDTQGTETAHSMICDPMDNLYVFGATSSLDFPIVNGFQTSHGGGQPLLVAYNGSNFTINGTDIYVAKISANGHNLLASTYIGGSDNDGTNYNVNGQNGSYNGVFYYDSLTTNYGDQFRGEIMLDSIGNCYVASCSRSLNFPVLNPIQAANAGQQDGVIVKMTGDLSNLIFSTYIGGSNNDACYSMKIDTNDAIVFTGGTSSNNLPATAGAWQTSYNGGNADGFVGRMNSSGTILERISYIGTINYDQSFFVEIDEDNLVYLLGQSSGGIFPIINAAFSNPNSGQFIVKLSNDLSTILNATVFGNGDGQVNISPSAFLVDICGNIYVSGWGANLLLSTPLNGMPVTGDAFLTNPANGFDFYLMVMSSNFNTLKYGTYLGGAFAREHVDGGTSRFDKNGVVYQSVCGGCGGNSDFPTTPGVWSNNNLSTNCNNLIFKFDFKIVGNSSFSVTDTTGCSPFAVTFQNTSSNAHLYNWSFGDGTSTNTEFNPSRTFIVPGEYDVYLAIEDTVCDIIDTMKTTVIVTPQIQLNFPNDSILCVPNILNLIPNTFGTADQFIWSSQNNFNDTLNFNLNDSSLQVNLTNLVNFYFKAENLGCERIDSVNFDVISAQLALQDQIMLCNNDSVIVQASSSGNYPMTYVWTPATMIQNQLNDSTIHITNQSSGYLYVDVISSNNCSFKDSILIQINPLSVSLTVPDDTIMCQPSNLVLTANSLGTSNQYIWSSNSNFTDTLNNSILNPIYLFNGQNSGTYYIKTYTNDCQRIDSVTILIISSEIDLLTDGLICQNEAFNINLINSSGLNLSYTWRPTELIQQQTSATSIIANTSNPGYVYVDVVGQNGCSFTDSVYANVSSLSQTVIDAFASDTIVLAGSEVTLTALPNGNYNYQWTPQANLSSPNSSQTTATVNQTTTYYVQINEGNCTTFDTVTVYCYNNECKPPQVYVPNAFSPNGKGKNELLLVRGPNIDKMLFRIYNRWGQLVFESTDPMIGWDGTFEGKKVDPDVFDYYLQVKCIGGNEETIKGNVTVLK